MNTTTRPSHPSFRTAPARRVLLTSIASLLAAHAGFAVEAVFSGGAITTNADSGVSAAKTYTALGNIVGGNVTVNGQTFLGTGTSGVGWQLNGVPNAFSGFTPGGVSGSITGLFNEFQYGGNPATFDVSGLTPGQTYVATFYNAAFGGPGGRIHTVSANGASTSFDENSTGANVLRHTFVATGTTTTVNFAPLVSGDTWHFYGFSNEKVFNNTWSPTSGSSWNTAANWSTGVVPNAVGTNASFSAQAGPNTVSFTSSRTVGHVEFLGTGSYTIAARSNCRPTRAAPRC